jgi:aldose 1-epimerase
MKNLFLAALMLPAVSQAGDYSAQSTMVDGMAVIRLVDGSHRIEVSIAPELGNNAYEMKVNGKHTLWSPYRTLGELRDKPVMAGNPLLAPWANRIDGDSYWANGRKYLLNPDLRNFRYDPGHKPIHGLLVYAKEWKVTNLRADRDSASVTSRLEFWRYPEWMAQFPFAHNIEITYRLSNGALEVRTVIENLSGEPMPLSLGYHTYYRIDDTPRDDCKVHVPARQQVVVSESLIPTGELKPVTMSDPQSLRGYRLDDGFTGLIRDSAGRAEFWVQGKEQRIKIIYGPKYDVAIVFAPPGRDFICFEPMVGLTNVFNLSEAGIYKGLQSVAPGAAWAERFWVVPEGY